MAALFGKFLLLSLVAFVYSRPQEQEIDGSLYVADERCPPNESHHLLPHEYDCTKFYYCEYGLRHEIPRDCAPGTEFCFDHGVCIHASLANCPLTGIPPTTECPGCASVTTTIEETTTTTPEPTTTTTTAEPTTTTTTTTTTTPEPTTPEATTPCDECVCPICPTTTETPSTTTEASTTTTQASTTTSTTTTTTTTEAPTTTAVPCTECPPCPDLTTVAPTSSTPWVPTTTNAPSVTLPNGCPADFDFHHLLPHETQCYLYYECVFGETIERTCAPGTYFVFDLQACEHAALANCTLPGTSTLPTTISTSSTEWVPTTTSAPAVTLPNGCPADFGINHLLPHETECDRFYQCVFGETVLMSCAPGTHFVFELQLCDSIESANCTLIGTTQTPCPECPSATSTTTVAPNTTEEVTTTTTTLAPNTTEEVTTTTTTLAPSTTEAVTTTTTTVAPITTEATTTTSTTEAPITTAAPCPECPPCPDTITTTTQEPTTTPAPCPDCPVCPICPPVEVPDPCETDCHVPHWAHETDCDKFWRCEGNQKALGVCAEGLHFNVATQTCDFMCNANCIREEVQSTAEKDGLKVFLPWEKVDTLVKLTKYEDMANINFGDFIYQMRI